MATVHIPDTVEALKTGLGGIERLLTAKQWERAAIVYAWTEPNGTGLHYKPEGEEIRPLPIRTFAALGITGLRYPEQVRDYRDAWEKGGGARDIKPGDDVVLPDAVWKDHFGEPTSDVQERVAESVMADPKRAAAVLKDPKVAKAVAEVVSDIGTPASEAVSNAIANRPLAARAVDKAREERVRETAPVRPHIQPEQGIDYSQLIYHAMADLNVALVAKNRGLWTPSVDDNRALSLIRRTLDEDEAVGGVFEDIDRFLKGVRP